MSNAMDCKPAADDVEFCQAFENGKVAPDNFHHRDHLRLAYVCLCQDEVAPAITRVRTAIQNFLDANGVPPEKYHETMTVAWIHAVRHFMQNAGPATSFDEFIAADERLLDMGIMHSHYSKEQLFSESARQDFVTPDIQDIPRY